MSNVIDERIVEMKFDNADFERNAQTSMRTLSELKNSLNLEDAGKGLDSLTKISDKFNLDGVGNAVSNISDRFTALGTIATGALLRIGDQAVQTGERMLKALTIDPIKTGFEEYELKMDSVQTIMAGTGEDLQTVSKYLEELNLYADKTIYSFSDMTNSIGKFTNAGVKLDDAVSAIQGIANEAAVSGANAQQASHAMYNFAQALSSGFVKLIDWKSIENANMATVEFKQQLLETAVALGTVKKEGDKFVTTTTNANGKISDAFNATLGFNDSLAHQWMTTDVLTKTLAKYADETTDIGKKAFAAAQDLKTFSQMWDTLKEAAQSGWSVTMETIIGDFDEAKVLWTAVGNEISGILDAQSNQRNELLKEWKSGGGRDALLESFKNIWQNLKAIIKPIREAFREIFPPTTSKQLLDITNKFKEITKKFKISESTAKKLKDTFKGLFSILNLGKKVITNLFRIIVPAFGKLGGIGSKVLDFTSNVGKMITSFVNGEKAANKFGKTFDKFKSMNGSLTNFVSNIKDFLNQVKNAYTTGEAAGGKLQGVLKSLFTIAQNLTDAFFDMAESLTGLDLTKFRNNLRNSLDQAYEDVKNFVANVQDKIKNSFNEGGGGVGGVINVTLDIVDNLAESLLQFISDLTGLDTEQLRQKIADGIQTIKDKLQELLNKAKEIDEVNEKLSLTNTLINGLKSSLSVVTNLFKKLVDGFTTFVTENPFLLINTMFAFFHGKTIDEALKSITGFFNSLTDISKSLSGIGGEIKKTLNSVKDALKSFQNEINAKIILELAISIGILALALKEIAEIDATDLGSKMLAVSTLFGELVGAVEILSKTLLKVDIIGLSSIASAMLKMSAAIFLIAEALKAMDQVDPSKLMASVGALSFVFAEIIGAFYVLKKLKIKHISLSIQTAVLAFAEALNLMADAISKFATITDPETLRNATLAAMGCIIALAVGITFIGAMDIKSIGLKTSLAIIAMAAAIWLLADAINKIATMQDPERLISSLVVIGGMLIGLTLAVKFLGDTSLGSVLAIAAFAYALKTLSDAIVQLNDVNPGMLITSVIMLSVAIGVLTGACYLLGETGPGAIIGAVAIVIMSAALRVLADALVAIGNLEVEKLVIGMMSLTLMLTMLAAAVLAVPSGDLIATGVGLLLMSIGIRIVADALIALSNLTIDQALNGIAGLGGALVVLALALGIMKENIMGAAALTIAAVGIVAIAEAFKMMEDCDKWVDSLVALGLAIITLSIAATALQGAIVGAAALLILGVALMAIAEAFKIMEGLKFEDMVGQIAAVVLGLGALGGAAMLLAPALMPIILLGGTLLALIGMLAAGVALLGLATLALGAGLSSVGLSAASAGEGMQILGKALTDHGKAFKSAAGYLLPLSAGFLAFGISSLACAVGVASLGAALIIFAAGLLTTSIAIIAFLAATQSFKDGVNSLLEDIPNMIEQTVDNLINLFNRVAQIVDEKTPELIEAVRNLFRALKDAAIEVLTSAKEDFHNAGKNLVTGLINGIKSMVSNVVETATNLAKSALNSIKSVLDIHSPSRETESVGEYFDKGFINGLVSLKDKVGKSAAEVGKSALDAMTNSISELPDALDGDINTDPVIRPVMDLSNIRSGVNELNTMMQANKMSDISASFEANRNYRNSADAMNKKMYDDRLTELKDAIIAINDNKSEIPVNVNVSLEGEAAGVFKMVQNENNKFIKQTGRGAFA